MKANPNLDELLSSFMDGELSPRQRTEVQRMAARNPEVSRRLRQLEKCRTLYASLPPAEAPADMLDQVKQSLERRTLLRAEPTATPRTAGRIHLVFRKFVAAAAMIALLGVLGAVVYQIVSPVPNAGELPVAATNPVEPTDEIDTPLIPPVAVADAGITGRLELRTEAFAQGDAFVRRAIENAGLSDIAQIQSADGQRVFRVTGTREGVTRLVASLDRMWSKVDGAVLQVARPGEDTQNVQIDGVTPEQAAAIVARGTTEDSIEAAQAYAAMNHLQRTAPGSEILSLIQEQTTYMPALAAIPRPVLTSNDRVEESNHAAPERMIQADLTIVLLPAR